MRALIAAWLALAVACSDEAPHRGALVTEIVCGGSWCRARLNNGAVARVHYDSDGLPLVGERVCQRSCGHWRGGNDCDAAAQRGELVP